MAFFALVVIQGLRLNFRIKESGAAGNSLDEDLSQGLGMITPISTLRLEEWLISRGIKMIFLRTELRRLGVMININLCGAIFGFREGHFTFC